MTFCFYFFFPSPEAIFVASSIVRAITLLTFPSSILNNPPIVHPPGVETCSLMIAGFIPDKTNFPVPTIATNNQPQPSLPTSTRNLLCAAITTASDLGTPIMTPPSAIASTISA